MCRAVSRCQQGNGLEQYSIKIHCQMTLNDFSSLTTGNDLIAEQHNIFKLISDFFAPTSAYHKHEP